MKLSKDKIYLIMAEQNLFQKDLADKANMGRGNLSTLLNGKSCQAKTAHKIAKALGVDVTNILEL